MKVVSILRSVFALVYLGCMIYLWEWNITTVGVGFAIFMIAIPILTAAASIYDNITSFRKK